MNVLVLNVGSSSLKFQLIGTDAAAHRRRRAIGAWRAARSSASAARRSSRSAPGTGPSAEVAPLRDPDHAAPSSTCSRWLMSADAGRGSQRWREIEAVGPSRRARRRAVHALARASTTRCCAGSRRLIELAPLHNPHNLRGIAAARAVLGPGVPQVAVFDTAFHHTPPRASPTCTRIPYQLYRRHACGATAFTAPRTATSPTATGSSPDARARRRSIITLHLGNGCSACAIARRRLRRHVDGLHAARGARDGHALRRLDPAILDFVAGQGRADAARAGARCSTSSPACSASPGSPPTCASCSPRRPRSTTTGARAWRSSSSATACGSTSARISPR